MVGDNAAGWQFGQGLGGRGHRGHRSGVVSGGGEYRLRPAVAQPQEGVGVVGAGGPEGDQLAVGVPGRAVGTYAERREQEVGGRSGDAEGRLGGPGVGDGGALGGPLLRCEGGGREHPRHAARVRCVQHRPQPREGDEQVPEHAGTLAALPREEESDPAQLLCVGAHMDAVIGGELPGPVQLGRQVVKACRDDRDLDLALPGRRLACEVAQRPGPSRRVVLFQPGGEAVDRPQSGGTVRAPEAEELGGPVVQPVRGLVRIPVPGEDGVVVGASEPEGADGGEPSADGLGPRPGLRVEAEGAGVRLPVGVGAGQM